MTSSGLSFAQIPGLNAVQENARRLDTRLVKTPTLPWPEVAQSAPFDAPPLWAKLELFQRTGCFKFRSALTIVDRLTPGQRARGLVSVSSGNFAIAAACAAQLYDTRLTVFMARSADPYRIGLARNYGAEIRLTDDNVRAFEEAREIGNRGEATFIHPWDGPDATLGTASIALELDRQLPEHVTDFYVAVGGGSLASGFAPTIKGLRPGARVIGVEPKGAPTLSKSLEAGAPSTLAKVNTVADSLAAPFAEPYSFEALRAYLDDMVLVSDDDILASMEDVLSAYRLMVEPSAATALAGWKRHADRDRPACIMVCGSNIGLERYLALRERASGGFPAAAVGSNFART